jgi:hypothetical protein
VCALILILAVPATARTGSIRAIDNADTIFLYEENLDISGLRSGANPVTGLRKYVDDDATKAMVREIPVESDTSLSLNAGLVADQFGIYYGYNPTDGSTGKYVRIAEPRVEIDVVLADPNHADSVQGLTISEKTSLAFKISAPEVGPYYRYGTVSPATVDVVMTTPGGGELAVVQGRDFRGLNISSSQFYTDDPGRPGAFTFQGLKEGTYRIQAKWRMPVPFDNQAPDSNIITWNIGGPTPVTATTTAATPRPTTPATTPITPSVTGTTTHTVATTTAPPTAPPIPAATTAAPSPTPAPGELAVPLAAAGILLLTMGRRRGR